LRGGGPRAEGADRKLRRLRAPGPGRTRTARWPGPGIPGAPGRRVQPRAGGQAPGPRTTWPGASRRRLWASVVVLMRVNELKVAGEAGRRTGSRWGVAASLVRVSRVRCVR